MILIDTNVISELWKVEPNPDVLTWIDAQAIETLYLSAVTVAELRFGLATMPQGKRRTINQERLEKEVLPTFTGRGRRQGEGYWQCRRPYCRHGQRMRPHGGDARHQFFRGGGVEDCQPLGSRAMTTIRENYRAWRVAEIQAAIDAPRPSIPHEEVMAEVEAEIARLKEGNTLCLRHTRA